jgi:hypothetical protein
LEGIAVTEHEDFKLNVVDCNGNEVFQTIVHCFDEVPDERDKVKIETEIMGTAYSAVEDEYFSALCTLRMKLESAGFFLNCYGSSENVYPSGMSAGMGVGDMAYRMTLGKRARQVDLVNIFDTGPDVKPTTVARQKEFYNRWLESL